MDAFAQQASALRNVPAPSAAPASSEALISTGGFGYLQSVNEGSRMGISGDAPYNYTRQFVDNPQNFSHLATGANPQTPTGWSGSQADEKEIPPGESTLKDARICSIAVQKEPGNRIACAILRC